jgi:hypothetical protein
MQFSSSLQMIVAEIGRVGGGGNAGSGLRWLARSVVGWGSIAEGRFAFRVGVTEGGAPL